LTHEIFCGWVCQGRAWVPQLFRQKIEVVRVNVHQDVPMPTPRVRSRPAAAPPMFHAVCPLSLVCW
jgi:hypothetical protein